MNAADNYRAKAAELDALARPHSTPTASSDYRRMAHWYRRLAEQAERNTATDVTYEPPFAKSRETERFQHGTLN